MPDPQPPASPVPAQPAAPRPAIGPFMSTGQLPPWWNESYLWYGIVVLAIYFFGMLSGWKPLEIDLPSGGGYHSSGGHSSSGGGFSFGGK